MPWQVGDYAAEGEKPFDQGSFGTVWRARRLSDNAPVALKLVLLTEAADAREKIAAERHGAMLQQQFEHAHGMVPKVYAYGHDGEDFFIAMELVEGGALADKLKAGALDARVAAGHAIRICEFLERAHGFAATVEGEPYDRLVHADLKPGHVLIDEAGGIKVLDFGIAKALAKTTQVTTNNWGTSAYASPERLDHGHVNEHVDYWSLGVILYEMISGHRPYPSLDRNRSQLEHAIRSNTPRAPLPGSCPPDMVAIISKLLAYQVERRYPTAAAIREDLERFLSGGKPIAAAEYATPPTMPIERTMPRRPTPVPVESVPPTDPLPMAGGAAVAVADPVVPAVALPAGRARGHRLRRAVWLAALLYAVTVVATDAAAWLAAGRFRQRIEAIDGPTLADARGNYDSIEGWSVLDTGLRLRVNGPLLNRLVAIGDSVIADYRREEPAMGPVEWKQAQDALRWAVQLSPDSPRLRSRLMTAEAHVIRLSSRGQPAAVARQADRRAIEKFEAAAALDERSYDPYLGISRIQVYGLNDVDKGAAAILEAETRGYVSGRRERALLGDGYMKRAQVGRSLARALSGDQRRRELEKARADFTRCIESFDPIVGFGRAAANLELCKRYLQQVEREIENGQESL